MVSFFVVGEGRPARAVLDAMVKTPAATVDGVALVDPPTNPLAPFAQAHGLPVMEVARFLTEAKTLPLQPGGWLINANSTTIIPADALARFQGRSLNLHPGLLPEYAGLHTHQWAIRNGETEFGVTIHRMEAGVDTGAIVGELRFPIKPEDTGLSLFSRCLAAGSDLFARVVGQIVRGETLADIPQDLSRRRLYRSRDAMDGRIDWRNHAQAVVDFIRAGNYEPFASPTYTARLDRAAGDDVEALRGLREDRASTGEAGSLLEISEEGPLIMCGDGGAVRIVKARCDGQPMSVERWRAYFAQLPSARLQGRGGGDAEGCVVALN